MVESTPGPAGKDRRIVYLLFVPPAAMLTAGWVIHEFRLFPVVVQTGNSVTIFENPFALPLMIIGAALFALPIILLWARSRDRRNAGRKERTP